MLALRTSFVALLHEEDDPVLDSDILIWGISGATAAVNKANFRGGQTFTLICFVYSETEDDIQANLVPIWQKSVDEGASWVDIDPTASTRHSVNWFGQLYGEISGTIAARYFDVAWLINAGFQLDDVGVYRLKVTGGILDPAYSPGTARIGFDSNPG